MTTRWRAVAICHDPEEGVYPDARREDECTGSEIIAVSPDTFASASEAEEWADAFDFEATPDEWDMA